MSPQIVHDHDQPILDVSNVSVTLGDHLALEKITFHLHIGERVAVVGPNGAGKSTLFKVISGVLPVNSGSVNVFGSASGIHTCIAYIPQRSQVDWRFPVNVYDVVMMGRTAKIKHFSIPDKQNHAIVNHALETVDMLDLSDRQIGRLSGGQQQRMFIARALAQEAELMLMDEPLSGLDDPAQESLLMLMKKLEQEKVTIMTATHDLDQAVQYFDRLMLLNRRIIGFGQSSDVLTSDNLKIAYGGRMRFVGEGNGFVALDHSCCDGGEEN